MKIFLPLRQSAISVPMLNEPTNLQLSKLLAAATTPPTKTTNGHVNCVVARAEGAFKLIRTLEGVILFQLDPVSCVMEFVSPEGLRQDGRRPQELRQLRCQLSVLQNADGSATFEMGNTKVLAAVFGPREVVNRSEMQQDRAIIKCEYAMAAFSTGERRKRGKTDRRSTELSMMIQNTIEQTVMVDLLPRSQIDVLLHVLQADGGTRTACINAAMLALADAGIPLRDMVASCAAGYLQGTPLLDLNYLEDSGGGPDVSVALHPNLDKIVLLQADNRLPFETFETVLQLAESGCKAVGIFMRQALLEHTQRLAVARGSIKY